MMDGFGGSWSPDIGVDFIPKLLSQRFLPFLPHSLPRCLRKLTRLADPHLFPIILQLNPNNSFILHKLPHGIRSDVAHPLMQLQYGKLHLCPSTHHSLTVIHTIETIRSHMNMADTLVLRSKIRQKLARNKTANPAAVTRLTEMIVTPIAGA